jgi:hypothetical protein
LLGGLVGGVVIFFWGALAHMTLPLGTMGISRIDPGREVAVLASLKGSIDAPGFYFVPGMDMSRTPTEAEQRAWDEKLAKGPSGVLIVTPNGGEAMSPRQLLTEFGTGILAALVASWLVLNSRAGYWGRVLSVAAMGLFGWISISLPYWNWYHFPTAFTAALLMEEVIGWFLAGLAIAAIVKGAPTRSSVFEAAEELVMAA